MQRKIRRWVKRFTLVTALVLIPYFALSPAVCTSLYEGHFFRPDYCREPTAKLKECFAKRGMADVRKTELYIESGQGRLHACWFNYPNTPSSRTVLIHHGAAGNIAARAELIALLLQAGRKHGYSVLIYEYRGFGDSEAGGATLLGVTEDGLCVYDFLLEKGYQPEDILHYGESLGGAVSTHIATQRKVSGIVTQGTFSSLSDIGWERGTQELGLPTIVLPWTLFGETFFPPRMDNVGVVSAADFDVPLLVVHGEQDVVVPVSHAERIFQAARSTAKQKLILPKSGHSSISAPDDEQAFIDSVEGFIGKLNGGPRQLAPHSPGGPVRYQSCCQ